MLTSLTIRAKIFFTFGLSCVLLLSVAAMTIYQRSLLDTGTATGLYNITIGCAFFGILLLISTGIHFHTLVCGGLIRQRKKFLELRDTLDLSGRSVSPRHDEFGGSAAEFDQFMARIEMTIRSIREATDSVAIATREIAGGNQDLSHRTEQQAAAIEETSSSLRELSDKVRSNAEHAQQADDLVASANEISMQGHRATSAMVAHIEKFNGTSSKISEITGVIEGISFQTNILALNAAVEAARAGDQGRGFAVVASEVRSLAQRSAMAAREIKEILLTSVANIQAVSQQAQSVQNFVTDVQQAVSEVAQRIQKIARASSEQSIGIGQIHEAILQMDKGTQQNAALVEETAAAAASLREQAIQLRNSVGAFKIGSR